MWDDNPINSGPNAEMFACYLTGAAVGKLLGDTIYEKPTVNEPSNNPGLFVVSLDKHPMPKNKCNIEQLFDNQRSFVAFDANGNTITIYGESEYARRLRNALNLPRIVAAQDEGHADIVYSNVSIAHPNYPEFCLALRNVIESHANKIDNNVKMVLNKLRDNLPNNIRNNIPVYHIGNQRNQDLCMLQ